MSSPIERAHRLVQRFGWNTTCYQIINPGIEHWFDSRGDAVVGFVRRQGVRVVAGAPVCAKERLSEVLQAFEESEGDRVCYFGAEARLRETLSGNVDYAIVSLGSQPVWTPTSYLRSFEGDASLRAQRNRSRNKDVVVHEWDATRATSDPRLREVLDQWLRTRGLPTMHFLVEPYTLDYLFDRRLFVAERAGVPVAFVTLCPAPARDAWLTEQFVRGDDAPNGTIEHLLWRAIGEIERDGASMVTMGIVPLSTAAEGPQNPPWLDWLGRWARAHGRRFYDFDGLEWFKRKFHPDGWEPVYVVSKEPTFSPRALWAIVAAFSDGSPAGALLRGMGRALASEVRTLLSSD
jgi:phosphatidylglycerol lysyltransferase